MVDVYFNKKSWIGRENMSDYFNLINDAKKHFDSIMEIAQLINKKGYWNEPQPINENVEQHIMSLFLSVFMKGVKIDDEEANLINVLLKKQYTKAKLVNETIKLGSRVLIQVPVYLTSCIKMDLFESTSYSLELIYLLKKLGLTAAAADKNVTQEEVEFLTVYISTLSELVRRFGIKKPMHEFFTDNKTSSISGKQHGRAKSDIECDMARVNEYDDSDLSDLLCELNGLIGLEKVKQDVNTLVNLLRVRRIRQERGLPIIPMSFHLVFTGNPGTGKTTVARLISKIYNALGLLSKGHMVEVDRSALVAGYVGQTAAKVQEVVKSSMGGVLFIDEAYSLVVKDSQDFGMEAISTLLKAMEDNRENLVVIAAGYMNEMERFINSNPGLRSRFNKYINFEDYTPDQMLDILKAMCKKSGYTLSPDAQTYATNYFTGKQQDRIGFGNARGVRNFLERAISRQASRIVDTTNPDDKTLMTIEAVDLMK